MTAERERFELLFRSGREFLFAPVIEHGPLRRAERDRERIEAEGRRVLVLENPALRGQSLITDVLYGGLQLILPGEVAPSHRHTQSALRFIVEGEGAYTAVDGERTIMREGDFVITPTWTWHDHGNDSSKPMVWLDGLDIPLVAMFNAGFAENGETDAQTVTTPQGTSEARFGSGLLPVDWKPTRQTSPIFTWFFQPLTTTLQWMFDRTMSVFSFLKWPGVVVLTGVDFALDPRALIGDAMALMSEKKIRHLPVLDRGIVLGMISISDLMDHIISDHELTIAQLESYIHS